MSEIIRYKFFSHSKNGCVQVSWGVGISATEHRHDCIELSYVTGGHAEHSINGKTVTLAKGDFFAVDLDASHTYLSASRGFPVINIRFLPTVFDSKADKSLHTPDIIKMLCPDSSSGAEPAILSEISAGRVFHDRKNEIYRHFRNAKREWEKKAPGWQELVRGELAHILIYMLRADADIPASGSSRFIVNEIISYVDAHYAEPIQLSKICRMCNYTMSYVSRVFRENMGQSFSAYLMQVRVKKACELLDSGDMTVEKVGNAVGYSNTSFFYRVFESYTGMTPKAYRNRNE